MAARYAKAFGLRAFATCFVLLAGVLLRAQDDVYPKKPAPARIFPDVLVIADQVVQEQWPLLSELVNAPSDLKQVEPGQCVHLGVAASGDNRDQLLRSVQFTFQVEVAGKTQAFTSETAEILKDIKPEGGDFVTQALGAAGLKNPMSSLASLAVSKAKWCAPDDTQDGAVTFWGTAAIGPQEKSLRFHARTLKIETFESARKKQPFSDANSFGEWVQNYHFAPDPAQLLPGLRIMAKTDNAGSDLNVMAFFIAAFKASPAAAEETIRKLPNEQALVRSYAAPLLAKAGYADKLNGDLKANDQTSSVASALPDAFDLTPDRQLPSRMGMLWATFFATGRIEPVKAIVSMLAWRPDYDQLMKMREAGQQPEKPTDSIMRAACYASAGWSLSTLSRNDGLLTDYIETFKSSSETAPAVKAELANLHTNPAFQDQH